MYLCGSYVRKYVATYTCMYSVWQHSGLLKLIVLSDIVHKMLPSPLHSTVGRGGSFSTLGTSATNELRLVHNMTLGAVLRRVMPL